MSEAEIIALYNRVLRREPGHEEVEAWLDMARGGLSLDQVCDAMVASTEANAIVDPLIRLYQAAFGRQPDPAGLDFWASELRAGKTVAEIAQRFAVSQEFVNAHGGADIVSASFVVTLYDNILGRTPSAAEVEAWVNSGLSRGEVLHGFAESAEAIARCNAPIDALLDGLGHGATALDPWSPLPIISPATGETFPLSDGFDEIVAGSGDDDVDARAPDAWSDFDTVDGGAGDDRMTVVTTATAAPAAVSVVNVETLVVKAAGAGYAIDAEDFDGLGLLDLATAAEGPVFVALATTTAATILATGASPVAVVGGGGALSVKTGAAPVSVGQTAASNAWTSIAVDGGSTVAISDNATPAQGDGTSLQAVSLDGVADRATIVAPGLASLAISDTGAAVDVASDALVDLIMSGTSGDVAIDAAAGARTLDVTLDGVFGGTIADAEATGLSVSATGRATSGVAFDVARATEIAFEIGVDLVVSDLEAAALETVTVVGDADLNLTYDGVALTAFDASGLTAGDVTWTSGILAANATIKGGKTGTNTIDVSLSARDMTYVGGDGADVVRFGEGDDVIDVGAGDDNVSAGGGDNVITASAGDNVVTVTDGDNSITLGAGDDFVSLGAGSNTVDLGDGANLVIFNAPMAGRNVVTFGAGVDVVDFQHVATAAAFAPSLVGVGAGDVIVFANVANTPSDVDESTLGPGIVLGGSASFDDYLDAAARGDGGATSLVEWFQFDGDAYLVLDNDAGADFVEGVDFVVELAGPVDLGASTLNDGFVTIV